MSEGEVLPSEAEDLKPKKPSNRAPEGIRTFTVLRIVTGKHHLANESF